MNHNERAWHDWLDQELDTLTDSIPEDHPLLRTAAQLQHLDNAQQASPDDSFFLTLEQRLMPSHSPVAVSSPPIQRSLRDRISGRIGHTRPAVHRSQRIASAFSIFLLVAMIGGMALIAFNGRSPDNPIENAPGGAAITAPIASPQPDDSPGSLQELWRLPALTDGSYGGEMTAANGVIYRSLPSGDADGTIQALDAHDGHVIWTQSGRSTGFQIAADDLGVYFAAQRNGDSEEIVAMDAKTGRERWALPLGAAAVTMALYPSETREDGSTLLVKDANNVVWAIDSALGTATWQTSISRKESPTDVGIVPIATDGQIVIAQTTLGAIVALDFATGSKRWELPRLGGYSLIISGDTVAILFSAQTPLNALSLSGFSISDGSLLWSRPAYESQGVASQMIATLNGSIAVIARSLGPVVIGETGTPAAADDPGSISTALLFDQVPAAAIVFGVDPQTGRTTWATDEGSLLAWRSEDADPNIPTVPYALQTVELPGGGETVAVMTYDGRIGTLNAVSSQTATIQSMSFQGLAIGGIDSLKYNFRSLEASGNMVFIQLGSGVLVAYEAS